MSANASVPVCSKAVWLKHTNCVRLRLLVDGIRASAVAVASASNDTSGRLQSSASCYMLHAACRSNARISYSKNVVCNIRTNILYITLYSITHDLSNACNELHQYPAPLRHSEISRIWHQLCYSHVTPAIDPQVLSNASAAGLEYGFN